MSIKFRKVIIDTKAFMGTKRMLGNLYPRLVVSYVLVYLVGEL